MCSAHRPQDALPRAWKLINLNESYIFILLTEVQNTIISSTFHVELMYTLTCSLAKRKKKYLLLLIIVIMIVEK